MAADDSMRERIVFLLSKLGQAAAARFAERLAPLGLRPRHCAVLELLAPAPMTQLELARHIGVTPSVVVNMLDELETVGAVRRIRDTADRRRQLAELTVEGRRLRRQAVRLAKELDGELLAGLDDDQVEALRGALLRAAGASGIVSR